MGSIGTLMDGSGLSDALETCGPNAVIHMLSGKAFARGLRGHFLTDAALGQMLMKLVLHREYYTESGTLESFSEQSKLEDDDDEVFDGVPKFDEQDIRNIFDCYECVTNGSQSLNSSFQA